MSDVGRFERLRNAELALRDALRREHELASRLADVEADRDRAIELLRDVASWDHIIWPELDAFLAEVNRAE